MATAGRMTGRFGHFDARSGGSYRLVLAYADASAARSPPSTPAWSTPWRCHPVDARSRVGLRRTFHAVLGMVLSRSAVLAGWQCRQGVELGLVQGDVGRGGVGGDLHFSFRADDRRGDRRAG